MSKEITEQQIAGRRFRYSAAGRGSRRMTLRPDYRLEGAPTILEHSWEITDGKLVLRDRSGKKTVEFERTGRGKLKGKDLTQVGGEAWLIEDWRAGFPMVRKAMRELKYMLQPGKRPVPKVTTREMLLANSIGVRCGKKKLRWFFATPLGRETFERLTLPWVWPDAEVSGPGEDFDFAVGVYLDDETVKGAFNQIGDGKMKFLLSVEKETRFAKLPNCFSFVQNPMTGDDASYVRYAPTLNCWSPSRDEPKTKKCSVVDNGQYAWRADMIRDLAARIGDVDVFGKLSGQKLRGYHAHGVSTFGNDKYLGIESYCFYLALERAVADDYITEKFTDATMCNAVPVYDGAPNVDLYAVPGSYVLASDLGSVDWNNWKAEYEKRVSAVRAQKELLRTRLNLFSYFDLLTDDLSLLAKVRPITREM